MVNERSCDGSTFALWRPSGRHPLRHVRHRHGLPAAQQGLLRGLDGQHVRYEPCSCMSSCHHQEEGRIFPPEPGAKRERQRVDKSFETILDEAGITEFRFHDLRHTFASWYMMNGGDLYELAKILGHSNIRMTERYTKLGKSHIAKTGSTAREMWKLMESGMRKQAEGTA